MRAEEGPVGQPTLEAGVVSADDITSALEHARQSAGGRGFVDETHQTARRLYERTGYVPVWVDRAGRAGSNPTAAVALLRDAGAKGLDPRDYLVPALASQGPDAARIGSQAPGDAADLDVALTLAMLQYLRDVHRGRVDPRTLGLPLDVAGRDPDLAARLHTALAERRLGALADELEPRTPLYRALAGALFRYRALASNGRPELPPLPPDAVRPGHRYAGLPQLVALLTAVGDLPPDASPDVEAVYSGAVAEAVRRFQRRHGLDVDGVIGTATDAALRVPLSWRVRQIELALERLRWLPEAEGRRAVIVSIPMFRLWAWDASPPGETPAFASDVIVGRAVDTETPMLARQMQYVVFRPYWNIPRSIVTDDVLPAIRRQPDYLSRQRMEIVAGPGDDATPVAATAGNVARLAQGTLRLRQRPGPGNALGLVKFMFPNGEAVYLHDTPQGRLFSRARRDLSHGCVRVADATGLASWVLQPQSEWTPERIAAAMAEGPPLQVNLTEPIPVMLAYLTAVVSPEDGAVHFAADIYELDAKLDEVLVNRRP